MSNITARVPGIAIVFTVLLAVSCTCPERRDRKQTEPEAGAVEESLPDNSGRVTVDQGVWGDILFFEGDFAGLDPDGTIEPVSRQIYIYEPTTMKDVEWEKTSNGVFIRKVRTALLDSTTSDAEGFYQLELPPGEYSLFVREGESLYANHWSTGGLLSNFKVFEGRVTRLTVRIEYAARY